LARVYFAQQAEICYSICRNAIIFSVKIAELGEFGLIDILSGMAAASGKQPPLSRRKLLIGIGDDAAAWQCDAAVDLATVDSLIQNVHFSLETTSWYELGWKALAVNLSDIAAMGGVPDFALVSLSLPGDIEVADVEQFGRGMLDMAEQHGVTIIGGDTCRAPLVSVAVTVLGNAANRERLLRRSGARPGDKIAVTGYLGGAAGGFEMLAKGLKLPLESAEALRKALLLPQPRIAEGGLLVGEGVRTAIDVSDGLLADLAHICHSSAVSAKVRVDRIPVHPALMGNFPPEKVLELALSGGEDYELLFTADAETMEKVRVAATSPVSVIGRIEEGEAGVVRLIDINENPVRMPKAGWEHFKTE